MKFVSFLAMLLFTLSAAAAEVPLIIDQGTARQLTGGVWCGGIHVFEYAQGFDGSGNPTALVYGSTRCGGSGRGGGYRTTTHAGWAMATWDVLGALISLVNVPAPAQTPSTDAVFASAPYSEYTQVGGWFVPYVYDTAVLVTP